jgi:H+/Cl- antiporter ClcA
LISGVGLLKQVLLRIKERVDNTKLNGTIVVATLGGFLIGLTNYALPLTIGNGHLVSTALIQGTKVISSKVLRCSMWGRSFTMAVSMNCGFVGGFVFPLIAIGQMAGVLCHQQYDSIPLGMSLACFLAAVPSALCPMPFTMLGISCYVFFLGLQQTVPVFISCIVAYSLLTGIGVLGAMQDRAKKNQRGATDSFQDDDDKSLLVCGGDFSGEENVRDNMTMYGAKKTQRFTAAP